MSHPYHRLTVGFLTQHGKEAVVAAALEPALGCTVARVEGFDTDQLGTFTRDVDRAGTQWEAARTKALTAIELSGHPIGLGSEGSFDRHPLLGFVSHNRELIMLVDRDRDIEIVGIADGPSPHVHGIARTGEELDGIADRAGFPTHWLVVRPNALDDPRFWKGVRDRDELRLAFDWARELSDDGAVAVESDLRAHANPRRMERIAEAAQDLAQRAAVLCPVCGCPGFGRVETVRGLPCAVCWLPTAMARAHVHGCPRCEHREVHDIPGRTTADPQYCDACNP
jgi:hypothetical protein